MEHLTTETLARLVGEGPSHEEKEHLDKCSLCQSEYLALKEQTEIIGALPDLRPPSGDWEALEARLASEGLIRSSGLALTASRWRDSGWLQAAAALVLFLGGTTLGSGFTKADEVGGMAQGGPPADMQLIPVGGMAQPVSNLAEAAQAVNLAERQYADALLQYRQMMDAQGEPAFIGDPAARLAAVEAILATGRAALQQAPTDPFVNGVLVSAMAERAALRGASLASTDRVF